MIWENFKWFEKYEIWNLWDHLRRLIVGRHVFLVSQFTFPSQSCLCLCLSDKGCLKKTEVWAFADPASNCGEILNDFCGKSSCIMLWVGNFNAFIGRFADTALGAYRVWKGALKNKRLHKNKWFLNIIQTGINPTTPDLTGSTGFVTKNHKYFYPITSRICKCFIWQNSVFLRHPVSISHLVFIENWELTLIIAAFVMPIKNFCQRNRSEWNRLRPFFACVVELRDMNAVWKKSSR